MGAQAPPISIIIPTYARPQALHSCLESIAGLDYEARGFEVIVVDDGSPAPLREVAARFADRLDVRVEREENRGPAAARNAGAALARGPLLAFTDDDCLPDPGWLRALASRHLEAPEKVIGGRTINVLTQNPYSAASQFILDLVYAHYNTDPEHARFFASNNLAVPRELFLDIGGFDARFRTAEDRELCDRWRHDGRGMIYAREAMVRHAHPLTLPAFFRQHFRYGQGAFHYHRIRACRGSGRIAQELEFYRALWRQLRQRFSGLGARSKGRLLVLLLLWQAANAAGYVRAVARSVAGPGPAEDFGVW